MRQFQASGWLALNAVIKGLPVLSSGQYGDVQVESMVELLGDRVGQGVPNMRASWTASTTVVLC